MSEHTSPTSAEHRLSFVWLNCPDTGSLTENTFYLWVWGEWPAGSEHVIILIFLIPDMSPKVLGTLHKAVFRLAFWTGLNLRMFGIIYSSIYNYIESFLQFSAIAVRSSICFTIFFFFFKLMAVFFDYLFGPEFKTCVGSHKFGTFCPLPWLWRWHEEGCMAGSLLLSLKGS